MGKVYAVIRDYYMIVDTEYDKIPDQGYELYGIFEKYEDAVDAILDFKDPYIKYPTDEVKVTLIGDLENYHGEASPETFLNVTIEYTDIRGCKTGSMAAYGIMEVETNRISDIYDDLY